MQHRYFFLVPPLVHLLDITGPAHIFYELQALGQPISLHYLVPFPAQTSLSSAGLAFTQLEDFREYTLGTADTIFIPGIEQQMLFDQSFQHRCQPFCSWLRQQTENGATVCSVCTGAFMLARAGLLHRRACTTHWKYHARFRAEFPTADLLDNRLFVRAGNLWTSAGVASGIDLSLHLIAERYGPLLATQVAKETVVYLRRGTDDPQLSVFLRYRNHLNEQIHRAQDYLGMHLREDCRLSAVAAAVNMSPRNLSRRFRQHTGLTVGKYLRLLRTERAKRLLESGSTQSAAAAAVGLKSTNQLRLLLRDKLA